MARWLSPERESSGEAVHNADGKVYCLLDGPNEESIRRHHAALNVPCSEVHEVSSLL
jgi:hypothetical protein